jgi:hypothetical protein
MSRRTRKPPMHTASDPQDVLHVPALAGTVAPPEPEPVMTAQPDMTADDHGRVGYERQGTSYDPHAAGHEAVGRDGPPQGLEHLEGAPVSVVADDVPAPFGGKGDHDNNGKVGGAAPPQEKTLHELNIEQGFITPKLPISPADPKFDPPLWWLNRQQKEMVDRPMREQLLAAEAAHQEHVAPLLVGVQRPRVKVRRAQKTLRAPVKE